MKKSILLLIVGSLLMSCNEPQKEFFDNGQIKREFFIDRNNSLDGLSKTWYENGILSEESTYKSGKKDGLCKIWYENGLLAEESTYKNDEKDGLCKIWFINGQLKVESLYKNGQEIKKGKYLEYYKNGQTKYEYNYNENSEFDGLYMSYEENGRIRQKGTMIEGEKDGFWIDYEMRSHLEGTYVKGRKEGLWKNYYLPDYAFKHSFLSMEESYKNGELYLSKRYSSTGKLSQIRNYENGECTKLTLYDNEGGLIFIQYFDKNWNGAQKTEYFNDNGSLKKTVFYLKNGARKRTEYND
ncbi:MAG: toxin-antitoxin system YwqK family antitoxin [Flavobacteriales bacterium]